MIRLALALLVVAALAAPRSAAVIPTPPGGQQAGRPDQPRTAAPSTSAAGSPVPSPATDMRVAPVREVPDRNPSGTTSTLRGRASWVRASLGPRYLAARMPRGTVLTICGQLDCVTRTVTDYGPSKRKHPGRIVDMSRADFATICGDPERLGTCAVRVTVHGRIVPPETDTQGEE
mgnify:CR=1 FL=1